MFICTLQILLQMTADNTGPRRAVHAPISRFVHATDSEF